MDRASTRSVWRAAIGTGRIRILSALRAAIGTVQGPTLSALRAAIDTNRKPNPIVFSGALGLATRYLLTIRCVRYAAFLTLDKRPRGHWR